MAEKSIPLSKSYSAHEKTFDALVLREPTYAEIFREGLGRPRDWQPTPAGPILVTIPEVVDAYVQKLIVEPGYECIGQLNAADALALEEAVCGFFTSSTEPKKSDA